MQKNAEFSEPENLELYHWIQQQTYKTFNIRFREKFKKQYQTSNAYTVICSIWIVSKSRNSINLNKMVALANGTKSIPYSIYAKHKTYLLKDMHAQILIIKAFRKFILSQIIAQKSYYFIEDPKKNKFAFDYENFNIVLFSSEPFCGDCSINEENKIFSGSKPLKYFNCQKLPNQKFQKHVLRTKPGRTDLPQNKKSLSLSCSDKLALYNILGIQGKELFDKVCPVYISCMIVESDHSSQSTIKNGLNFVQRLAKLRNKNQDLIKRKLFNIKIGEKERKISAQFNNHEPKVFCLQKLLQTQNNLIEADISQKKKEKQGFEVSLVYTPDQFEWINSKTGLPEGCSLNNYMKQRKISQFSKSFFQIQLLNTFKKLQSNQQQQNSEYRSMKETFKYSAIKDRIKLLFGTWTDHFKSTNSHLNFEQN